MIPHRRDSRYDPYVQSIVELVKALDTHVPTPERHFDSPFMMPIEGAHTIPGRGTVVTGAWNAAS